jgi:hypothetical protein
MKLSIPCCIEMTDENDDIDLKYRARDCMCLNAVSGCFQCGADGLLFERKKRARNNASCTDRQGCLAVVNRGRALARQRRSAKLQHIAHVARPRDTAYRMHCHGNDRNRHMGATQHDRIANRGTAWQRQDDGSLEESKGATQQTGTAKEPLASPTSFRRASEGPAAKRAKCHQPAFLTFISSSSASHGHETSDGLRNK